MGDARIGRDVNVGAGTITCNHDGAHKHLMVIGDDAFIGSNASLVAPVRSSPIRRLTESSRSPAP